MISILYVDDEETLLEVAQVFLTRTGDFRVTISNSARKALELPSLGAFDVIVSDYQMPGMDGIAFLKTVRERFGDIPFILFTGKGREEVVIQAINNGADFYLQKGGEPVAQFAELAHKVRQAVRRKQAERSLFDSERRFSDIINFLPDATFAIDRSGVVIAWNRAIEEMTGVSASDMLGRGNHGYAVPFYGETRPMLLDMIDEPDEKIAQYYSNVSRTGTAVSVETDHTHPKGHQILVLAKACHLYNQAGEITGAIESIRDISEHRRLKLDLERKHLELMASYEQITAAEEELREQYEELAANEQRIRVNQDRLIMAQQIGHTGSWEYNPDTNEIWGSAEGFHIFGFRRDAGTIPIDEIEACIPDRQRVNQALVDLLTEGRPYNLEYAINPADGSSPRIVHSVARLEMDAKGRPVRVIGVIHDITERKQHDDQIAFSTAILTTQQETTLDAILIVDENGKIINYNRQFISLWGIPDDLVSQGRDDPVLQSVMGKLADPGAFLSRVRYLYEHRDEKSFEELILKDGRVLERFSAPMSGKTGKYYGRVWYFRDITRRRQAEDALRESEARFHSLFSNMIEGAALHKIIYDPHGIATDYLIVETNAAFEKHLGISREKVLGKTSREAYGVTEPPYLEIYGKVASSGLPVAFETYFPPLDKHFSISAYRTAPGHFATIFEDITGRKKAEDNLRKSEEQLRLFILHAPASLAMFDRQMRYIAASRRWMAEYNLGDRDITGISHYEIFPEISEDLKTVHRRGLTGEVISSDEDKFIRHDGTVQWLAWEMRPWYTADNAVGGIIIYSEDITRRKNTEIALRESEQRFRNITQNSSDMIRIIGRDGLIAYSSPSTLRLFGYPPEEVIGRDPLEFIHPDDKELVRDELKRTVLKENSGLPTGFRIRHREGHYIDVEAVANNLLDNPGINGIVVTTRPVTERKKAEASLQESESRFATIFKSSPAALTLVSAADGTFCDVNDTFIRESGYSRAETIGKTAAELGIFADNRDARQLSDALRVSQSVMGLELRCRNKSGEIRTCRFSAGIIHMDAKPYILASVEDVTEQKAAGEALRRSEEKYRLLTETSLDIIYSMDPEGNITYVSPHVSRYGYRPEELVFRNVSEVVVEEDLPRVYKDIRKTLSTGQSTRTVFRLKGPFKDPVWLEDNGTILKTAEGIPVGITGILRDVTERVKTEEALRKSREQLEEAMDLAHLVNWEYDVELDQFTFDDRFFALYGTSAEHEGTRMSAETYSREFLHPDDRWMVAEETKKALNTTDPGYISYVEHRIIRRDGEIRYLSVRVAVTKDAEGRTIKTHGANQDITDRRKAEEAVRENENKFRSLVETSPDMIWEVDTEGRFRYMSPMITRILGFTPEEVIGESISVLIPEDKRQVCMQLLAKALTAEGPIAPFEVPARHRDGHEMVIEIRPAKVISPAGKMTGLRGVAHDITQRRRNEEALRQADKKLRLLSDITRHDINNQLLALNAFAELLHGEIPDPSKEDYFVRIRDACGSISEMIAFTREYEKVGVQAPVWKDLAAIVEEAVQGILPNHISLKNSLQPGTEIYADPLVVKVFFNLLDNSIRHGVKVTEIRASSETSPEGLVVLWEDNGVGVPEDEKEEIFAKGFGKHTGLGMFLSREILSLTGISIRETGVPGSGARFEILVPGGVYRTIPGK